MDFSLSLLLSQKKAEERSLRVTTYYILFEQNDKKYNWRATTEMKRLWGSWKLPWVHAHRFLAFGITRDVKGSIINLRQGST